MDMDKICGNCKWWDRQPYDCGFCIRLKHVIVTGLLYDCYYWKSKEPKETKTRWKYPPGC